MLTQVRDLVSHDSSFGHWAGRYVTHLVVGIPHVRLLSVLREAEYRLDTTSSWIHTGSSRLLAHGRQAVGGTAESQIGSRAVRCILASSSAAIPIAVGLGREREQVSALSPRLYTVRFMLYIRDQLERSLSCLQTGLPHKQP